MNEKNTLHPVLEKYLVNLNKKIFLISKNEFEFENFFLSRKELLSENYLTYFNNDIQYGSKYIIKRFIDLTLSIIAMTIFLPVYIIIYSYILFLDGNQVIIKQQRVGLHGQQFNMYKFRTMYKNSHELRNELEEHNKNDEVIFKIENDPRIISGTNFLRTFSLDELPQFFNVLKGEMSIVGPRPLFDEDTKLFEKSYMRRLNVLPGITGLLQINDRNTSEFSTWYKYDLEYIENWSLYLDLKIILKTPLSLFSSKVKGL
jgi:lipopolysaccharide/colanic/teichoic acid biosynthesis glycosyltransferase